VTARIDPGRETEALDGAAPAALVDGLFRQHAGALFRYLRGLLGGRAEAEDLIQETYLRIWQRAQMGELRSEARAYLFQAALNAARDVARRRQVELRIFDHSSDPAPVEDPAASSEAVVAGREALSRLASSLMELEEFTRSVFLLYHIDHVSIPAIAQRTNRTTRTVERHLARALEHCSRQIKPLLRDG
jgi:RNA polymerase sigma factor (sigma-70 family)